MGTAFFKFIYNYLFPRVSASTLDGVHFNTFLTQFWEQIVWIWLRGLFQTHAHTKTSPNPFPFIYAEVDLIKAFFVLFHLHRNRYFDIYLDILGSRNDLKPPVK